MVRNFRFIIRKFLQRRITIKAKFYTKKFAHIHIPKTAGMSMLNHFGVKHPAHDPECKKEEFKKVFHIVPHHCSAEWIKENNALPEDCITFAFVRNPWDRISSLYLNHARAFKGMKATFEHWLNLLGEGKINHSECQMYFLTDSEDSLKPPMFNKDNKYSDKIIVDHVFRFENLHEDWKKLCNILNIPYEPLPKKNFNPNPVHYSSHYNDCMKELVERCFKQDIDYFGYEFEDKR